MQFRVSVPVSARELLQAIAGIDGDPLALADDWGLLVEPAGDGHWSLAVASETRDGPAEVARKQLLPDDPSKQPLDMMDGNENRAAKRHKPDLRSSLIRILLADRSEGRKSRHRRDEWLLVLRTEQGSQSDSLASLAENVRKLVHLSTASRVAATGEDHPALVAHLMDDPDRQSLLAAIDLASGDSSPWLRLFDAGRLLLALPEGTCLDSGVVNAFGHLLECHPQIVGWQAVPEDQRAVLAIWPKVRGDGFELVTTLLPHTDGWSLVDPDEPEVRLQHLEASASHEAQLHEALKKANDPRSRIRGYRAAGGGEIGHRLRLSPFRGPIGLPTTERLRLEIQDLEEQLQLVEALEGDSWRLFRFPQHQILALADVLRRLPISAFDDAIILYGFEAPTSDAEGVHYLLYRRNATVAFPEPSQSVWRADDDPPMAFWVDPIWQRNQRHGAVATVMVPEGWMLTPNLHGFHPEQMDAYLRRVIGSWLPPKEDGGNGDLPGQPLYLFTLTEDDDRVAIEVLDRDSFQPLRDQLAWINDNIELRDLLDRGAIKNFLGQWRAASERELFLKTQQDSLRRTSEDIEAKRKRLEGSLWQDLAGFLQRFADEARAVSRRAGEVALLVDQLTAGTYALEEALRDGMIDRAAVDRAATALGGDVDALDRLLDQLPERLKELDEEIDLGLGRSRARREELQEELRNARAELDRVSWR